MSHKIVYEMDLSVYSFLSWLIPHPKNYMRRPDRQRPDHPDQVLCRCGNRELRHVTAAIHSMVNTGNQLLLL
jgi:hypothetical protein